MEEVTHKGASFFILNKQSVIPPIQDLSNIKIDGGTTACKNPIGSGGQDVGHSGVATGRGAFNLSSSISVGIKKPPLGEVSLYPNIQIMRIIVYNTTVNYCPILCGAAHS